MKLSDKLIELRKEKGWSQEEFSEKLDVSRQAISRWENGTALPDAQNLLGISKLFDVSADYLLNDDYEGAVIVPVSETASAETEETAETIDTAETAKEETAPLVRKKKHLHWFLIPLVCIVIFVLCIIMIANKKPGHPVLNSTKENEIAPTCTAEGSYDEVIYCMDCGKEVLRTTKSIEKLSHTLSSSVKMNETAATCTAEGSYDEVVCCTVCNEEILRTHRSTAMVAHQFQNRKCIVCEERQPSEGLLFMSNGDGTCSVGIGDCTDEDIVIPDHSPSGDEVVQINAYAFAGRDKIKSIHIPETVTIIGESAFENCSSLEKVNLPKKITMIYSYTFSGCKELKEIIIPSGVGYIGEEAFAECLAIKSICIPANVAKIGQFAFRNLSNGNGIVTFENYGGWEVYDTSDQFVATVDFTSGTATPFEYLVHRFPEYIWKRN